jgi:hypothetical protein
VFGRDRDDDGPGGDVAAVGADGQSAVGDALDAPHGRAEPDTLAELVGQFDRDLLGASGEAVLLCTALHVEHPPDTSGGLDVAHGVQHRHLVRLAAPGHPGHDRHQIAGRGTGVKRAQPAVQRLVVEAVRVGGLPRLGDRYAPAYPLEPPLDARHIEQFEHRQPRNGAAVGADPAAPFDQVLAAGVGRHGLAAQLAGQFIHCVLRRADERAAEIDRNACDRRGRRPSADPVTALQHDDVVPEPDQLTCCGQSREPRPDDDDVRVRCRGHPTRLSRREGDDSAVRAHQGNRAGAGFP